MAKQMKVGQYVIAEALGAGSFATVYRGVDSSGTSVAIKCITIAKLTEDIASALETEISLQRQLSHRNIVSLIGVQRSSKYIFLTLEFCAGGDLSQHLRRAGPMVEAACLQLIHDLAAGLKYLHDRNFAHRDIKPQNLLLSSRDMNTARIQIADFGFARSLPPEALAKTLVGSPLYMAPELLAFKPYNTRADLWSVGVVLAEMLIGRPPFSGANPLDLLAHILANPWLHGSSDDASVAENAYSCGGLLPLECAARVSPSCKAVLRGLLRIDPEYRMTHEQFFASPWLQNNRDTRKIAGSPLLASVDAASIGAVSELHSVLPLPSSLMSPKAAFSRQDNGVGNGLGNGDNPYSGIPAVVDKASILSSNLRNVDSEFQITSSGHSLVQVATTDIGSAIAFLPSRESLISAQETDVSTPFLSQLASTSHTVGDSAGLTTKTVEMGIDSRSLRDVAVASLKVFHSANMLQLASTCRSHGFISGIVCQDLPQLLNSHDSFDQPQKLEVSTALIANTSTACHVAVIVEPILVAELDTMLEKIETAQLRTQSFAFAACATVAGNCGRSFVCQSLGNTNVPPGDTEMWAQWAVSLKTACAANETGGLNSWELVGKDGTTKAI